MTTELVSPKLVQAAIASSPDYVDKPNVITRDHAETICAFFNTTLADHAADFIQANDAGSHQILSNDPRSSQYLGKYRNAISFFFECTFRSFHEGNAVTRPTPMAKSKPTWNPARMADATIDAYSSGSFTSWTECCRVLLKRGYTAIEAEAILRSKWMRWARDMSGKLEATSRDLEKYLDRFVGQPAYIVSDLVAGYGDDYEWSYREEES